MNTEQDVPMSVVDVVLARHGLRWELSPYRIAIDSRPHVIIQPGPHFDIREEALQGARERTLSRERKRRQRTISESKNVTPEVANGAI